MERMGAQRRSFFSGWGAGLEFCFKGWTFELRWGSLYVVFGGRCLDDKPSFCLGVRYLIV
jgi:hypothetical protein